MWTSGEEKEEGGEEVGESLILVYKEDKARWREPGGGAVTRVTSGCKVEGGGTLTSGRGQGGGGN